MCTTRSASLLQPCFSESAPQRPRSFYLVVFLCSLLDGLKNPIAVVLFPFLTQITSQIARINHNV